MATSNNYAQALLNQMNQKLNQGGLNSLAQLANTQASLAASPSLMSQSLNQSGALQSRPSDNVTSQRFLFVPGEGNLPVPIPDWGKWNISQSLESLTTTVNVVFKLHFRNPDDSLAYRTDDRAKTVRIADQLLSGAVSPHAVCAEAVNNIVRTVKRDLDGNYEDWYMTNDNGQIEYAKDLPPRAPYQGRYRATYDTGVYTGAINTSAVTTVTTTGSLTAADIQRAVEALKGN